ncbi:MAG: sugar transferase [Acutalibacteraceae bacterium]|nr:sugar transferase [Acutalibacteraceae bacterium]
MYKRFFKRAFGIFFALLGLIVTSPIMLIIAILIKLESPGPVIFKQPRIGKDGKVFEFYKFRSMCNNAEKTGSGVYSDKNDSRVTKVGKFIRATSLDEIPQFVNVLKGDMAFIGPRPPLTYHPWTFDKYTEHQKKMFNVRPGLTGWAQVHGRKQVEWNKRIELNVWYVENLSFLLDLRILFTTVLKLFKDDQNENVGATVVKTPDEVTTEATEATEKTETTV